MKYTIVSIEAEERNAKRNAIREHVSLEEVTEIKFCDGRKIAEYLAAHPTLIVKDISWQGHNGEMGIWYSQMACWQWAAENGDLLVLEDDAIIDEDFMWRLEEYMSELPADWDFFALYYGDEQKNDYYMSVDGYRLHDHYSRFNIGSKTVTRAWQGYSSVANAFSQKGARKALELVQKRGIYTTCDCFLFIEAHDGYLDAYGLHPEATKFVDHERNFPSLKILKETR